MQAGSTYMLAEAQLQASGSGSQRWGMEVHQLCVCVCVCVCVLVLGGPLCSECSCPCCGMLCLVLTDWQRAAMSKQGPVTASSSVYMRWIVPARGMASTLTSGVCSSAP